MYFFSRDARIIPCFRPLSRLFFAHHFSPPAQAPAATQRAAEPTAASAGAHSHNAIGFELDEAEDGRRLAWCRDCDLAEGAGTIVDLQAQVSRKLRASLAQVSHTPYTRLAQVTHKSYTRRTHVSHAHIVSYSSETRVKNPTNTQPIFPICKKKDLIFPIISPTIFLTREKPLLLPPHASAATLY